MRKLLLFPLLLTVPGIVGSGCLGSDHGSSAPAPAPVTSTPPAPVTSTPPTLVASTSSLALSVNDTAQSANLTGNARNITLTNSGSTTATSVTYTVSPAMPVGTTITPASCGDVAPAGSCVLTVTPGSTPSANVGDTNPVPVTLTVTGTNTNTLNVSVQVLTYGSVHQSGYVFAIDDTTPATGSIGGKVAALTDQANAYTNPIPWSVDANGDPPAYDNIAGISENSTASPASCNGNVDGACNSRAIVEFYSPPTTVPARPPTSYAAGLCNATIDGRADWYLPAICELGYDGSGNDSGCGSAATPTLQNMQSNLVDNGSVTNLSTYYFSSTEFSANPAQAVFILANYSPGNSDQFPISKDYFLGVRCARAFTD